MRTHDLRSRMTALGVCWLAAMGVLLGPTRSAHADLQRRYYTDDRANFVTIGNSTGLDCRDSYQEKPIVGDVPLGPLGLFDCKGAAS